MGQRAWVFITQGLLLAAILLRASVGLAGFYSTGHLFNTILQQATSASSSLCSEERDEDEPPTVRVKSFRRLTLAVDQEPALHPALVARRPASLLSSNLPERTPSRGQGVRPHTNPFRPPA